jgi:hypothetical protein
MDDSSGRQVARVLPVGKFAVLADDFLADQHAEDFGGVPALGFRGRDDVGCGGAEVGQSHPA